MTTLSSVTMATHAVNVTRSELSNAGELHGEQNPRLTAHIAFLSSHLFGSGLKVCATVYSKRFKQSQMWFGFLIVAGKRVAR